MKSYKNNDGCSGADFSSFCFFIVTRICRDKQVQRVMLLKLQDTIWDTFLDSRNQYLQNSGHKFFFSNVFSSIRLGQRNGNAFLYALCVRNMFFPTNLLIHITLHPGKIYSVKKFLVKSEKLHFS